MYNFMWGLIYFGKIIALWLATLDEVRTRIVCSDKDIFIPELGLR